jgi:hypothetical protein
MTERAPINLEQFRQKLEAESLLRIDAGGKMFNVRTPELLTDEEYETLIVNGDGDLVAQARAMVDDYDGFVAAGGSALLLAAILKEHAAEVAEAQGVTAGESGPSSGS